MNIFLANSLQDNLLVIILVVLIILAVLILWNLFKTNEINRSIVKSRLKINADVRINSHDELSSATVQLVVANRNFQNINVIAFGIYYDHKLYDCLGEYKKNKNMLQTEKLYVLSQDSIMIELDIEQIKEIVTKTKRLKNIKIFAQDNLGRISKSSGKSIRKYILSDLKKDKMIESTQIKEESSNNENVIEEKEDFENTDQENLNE